MTAAGNGSDDLGKCLVDDSPLLRSGPLESFGEFRADDTRCGSERHRPEIARAEATGFRDRRKAAAWCPPVRLARSAPDDCAGHHSCKPESRITRGQTHGRADSNQHSDERRARRNLKSLQHALEVGLCGALKGWIDRFGRRLSTSSSPDIVAEYEDILRRAEQAFEIERVQGRESFSTSTIRWSPGRSSGSGTAARKASQREMVAAAERYRSLIRGEDR